VTPRIRPLADADTDGLAVLLGELGYPTTAGDMRHRLAQFGDDHQTLVAEAVDGTLSGFIGLAVVPVYEYSAPVGYILALSVGSAFQGQGIGKSLVAAAEDWFRQRGAHDIRVNSGLQRDGAHRFYESLGYAKTGFRFRKPVDES
jgi:GNAT superfamily N-acetyltransferase